MPPNRSAPLSRLRAAGTSDTPSQGAAKKSGRAVMAFTRLLSAKKHNPLPARSRWRERSGPEAAMSNTVDGQQHGENRYAVLVAGIVRYVGSLDECRRRALIFAPKQSEHEAQDHALLRAIQFT